MQRTTLLILGFCLLLSPRASAQTGQPAGKPEMEKAPVEGGMLEYEVRGPENGEPVLLIHGAVIAGSFVPIMEQPSLENYRLIRYHRRGYAGSTGGAGSLDRQVDDAVALLKRLEVDRAHVVGHSGGGRIALKVTLDKPEVVHSLVLLEPAGLRPVESRQKVLEEVVEPAMKTYHEGDAVRAMEIFIRGVSGLGPDWRKKIDQMIPGGSKQAEKDAETFFEEEEMATEKWQFDKEKAKKIPQRLPILYVWGSDSLSYFKDSWKLFRQWFPDAKGYEVEGAGHSLQMQKPKAVAKAIAAFLSEHPIRRANP